MDEGRKRVILIAAAILAARKPSPFDGGKRVPATVSAISDAVRWAEAIMHVSKLLGHKERYHNGAALRKMGQKSVVGQFEI